MRLTDTEQAPGSSEGVLSNFSVHILQRIKSYFASFISSSQCQSQANNCLVFGNSVFHFGKNFRSLIVSRFLNLNDERLLLCSLSFFCVSPNRNCKNAKQLLSITTRDCAMKCRRKTSVNLVICKEYVNHAVNCFRKLSGDL